MGLLIVSLQAIRISAAVGTAVLKMTRANVLRLGISPNDFIIAILKG
jgi:hypothetical protein